MLGGGPTNGGPPISANGYDDMDRLLPWFPVSSTFGPIVFALSCVPLPPLNDRCASTCLENVPNVRRALPRLCITIDATGTGELAQLFFA